MSRFEALLLHSFAGAVVVSGAAVAIAKYLLVSDDPFSVVSTPWQPWAVAAHVVLAPVLIFLIGYVFRRHVIGKLRDGRRQGKPTGLAVLYLFAFLAAGGYALQVTTQEMVRQVLSLSHLGAGLLFALVYAGHASAKAARGTLEDGVTAWPRAPRGTARATRGERSTARSGGSGPSGGSRR